MDARYMVIRIIIRFNFLWWITKSISFYVRTSFFSNFRSDFLD